MDNEAIIRIREAYRAVLGSPNGAAMLEDLVKTYVLSRNPYKDAIQAMRFEGRRDLVLLLLSFVREKPEVATDYLINIKEDKNND